MSLRRSFIASKDDSLRINDQIDAKEVRVIDENGAQLGVVKIDEALKKAKEMEVDLVEVSPDAEPPVCRLINYGKYLYQKEKKAKESRKKQKIIEIKEMKFRPKIDHHDFEYRIKQIREFLDKGDKVKITIRFRGRELIHSQLGFDLAGKIVDELKDLGSPEKPPKMEGRNIAVIISAMHKK